MSRCTAVSASVLSVSEAVFAPANLTENRSGIGAAHADGSLHGRVVGAQEGVGALFDADRRRDRWFAVSPQPRDLVRPALQFVIAGIDGDGELGVRERIFV